jgi:putative transposase
LWRCRTRDNGALEQRKLWWERGQGVGVSDYQQKAELPGLKAACPEFSELHAHVWQEVMLRLDRAFQAFFRRVKAGETPGYPRCQGRGRYNSFTVPEYGNGAVLDGRVLSLSKMGVFASSSSAPWKASPRPSRSAGRRMGGTPASPAPRFQRNHCRYQDTRPG